MADEKLSEITTQITDFDRLYGVDGVTGGYLTKASLKSLVGAGHNIQDEGTPQTTRSNLDFQGSGVAVTDDIGNDATVVTIDKLGPELETVIITATSYTITALDNGKLLKTTNAGAVTITCPENATEAIDVNFQCAIEKGGDGHVTIVSEGTDVIDSANGIVVIEVKFAASSVVKQAAGLWWLSGALTEEGSLLVNADALLDVEYTGTPAADEVMVRNTGKWRNRALNKGDVGLSSVDNTADVDKPVSTIQQTALDLKATAVDLTLHEGNTTNPHTVTKSQVGLGSCDDTSDLGKPISTATQTALDGKMPDVATTNASEYLEGDGATWSARQRKKNTAAFSSTLSGLDINTAVQTLIPFDTVKNATQDIITKTTNTRYTVIKTGLYTIGYNVPWIRIDGNTNKNIRAEVMFDGISGQGGASYGFARTSNPYGQNTNSTTCLYLTTGTYFEVAANQVGGAGVVNTEVGAELTIKWLGE